MGFLQNDKASMQSVCKEYLSDDDLEAFGMSWEEYGDTFFPQGETPTTTIWEDIDAWFTEAGEDIEEALEQFGETIATGIAAFIGLSDYSWTSGDDIGVPGGGPEVEADEWEGNYLPGLGGECNEGDYFDGEWCWPAEKSWEQPAEEEKEETNPWICPVPEDDTIIDQQKLADEVAATPPTAEGEPTFPFFPGGFDVTSEYVKDFLTSQFNFGPDATSADTVYSAIGEVYPYKKLVELMKQCLYNFCKLTEISIEESSLLDDASVKYSNIDDSLTAQLFNKKEAQLLSKYILSEEVIINMALFHTIFYPVEPAVGMDNLFLATKEYLFSLGESSSITAEQDPFYAGDKNYQDHGGAVGAAKTDLDNISTSRASSAIVSYFQNLFPKLVLKGLCETTDPAWKRVFSIQKLVGFDDKYLPAAMMAVRPVPLFPPPIGDVTAPITPFGMVYLGLSFMEPLSENFNAQFPDIDIDTEECE